MHEAFQNKKIQNAVFALATLATVFFAVKTISEIKGFSYIGQDVAAARTISFEGKGEAFAIPDVANISFGASKEGATVAEAQKDVTAKIDAALSALASNGIDKKDIQTTDYSATPRYEVQPPCQNFYCPTRDAKIIGYTVSQTITVKVRDTEKTGTILDGLAQAGVTNISGPAFAIDDEEAVKAEARGKAIDDAKEKAKILSKQLGVHLERITSFSESGNYPVYYAKEATMNMSMDAAGAPAPMPTIPTGQNKITSTVTITYEIR